MKKVLIEVVTHSLGDIISMVPYVEKYRNDYNDDVFLKIKSDFIFMFKESYPLINFIDRDTIEYDKKISIDYEWNLVKTKSLQENFAFQLGYREAPYIRPVIKINSGERKIKNKYISIGVHSTSQLKYWNHPLGKSVQEEAINWNELCGMIRKTGYTPVVVERDELFGVSPNLNGVPSKANKKLGQSIKESLDLIYHSEFYIGLSSGMSWAAHALGKPVAMISNFTEEWNEFDLSLPDYKRITNKSVCHGCWNQIGKDLEFDPGDWYWCPKHKDTSRHFECHTSITPEMVLYEIKEWISDTIK